MDQEKIGTFLRDLRKEKGLTQEQLAERFNVSSRTVSRWETGRNAPDLSTLVEIADFYQVDIREIMDGERKEQEMDKETKDILKKAAEYSEAQKDRLKKHVNGVTAVAIILLLFSVLLEITNGFGFIPEHPCKNMSDLAVGLTLVGFALHLLELNGALEKVSQWLGRFKQ